MNSTVSERAAFKNLRGGKLPAGAGDRFGSEQRMSADVFIDNMIAILQICDQRPQRFQLTVGRRDGFEVADKANADAVFIHLRRASVAAMCARGLIRPSLGDLDPTVRRVRTVADHKMITTAGVSFLFAMLGVDPARPPLTVALSWITM